MCVCPGEQACGRARVALLTRHATRTRHIVFPFVVSVVPPHSSTLSHKRHDFRKKVTEHKMFVLIFFTTSV